MQLPSKSMHPRLRVHHPQPDCEAKGSSRFTHKEEKRRTMLLAQSYKLFAVLALNQGSSLVRWLTAPAWIVSSLSITPCVHARVRNQAGDLSEADLLSFQRGGCIMSLWTMPCLLGHCGNTTPCPDSAYWGLGFKGRIWIEAFPLIHPLH